MKKRISALECNFLDNSDEITDKFFRFTNLKKIEEILDKKCDNEGGFIFDSKKWRVNIIIYSDIKLQEQLVDDFKDILNIYAKLDIYSGDFRMLFFEYIYMDKPKEISIKSSLERSRYIIKKIR